MRNFGILFSADQFIVAFDIVKNAFLFRKSSFAIFNYRFHIISSKYEKISEQIDDVLVLF